MLAVGSLRSPPMLKPAMTPERHPDGQGVSSVLYKSSSPPGVPSWNLSLHEPSHPQLSISPDNWGGVGRHERDLCGLGEAWEKSSKASYSPVRSNEGNGGVWQAAQRPRKAA